MAYDKKVFAAREVLKAQDLNKINDQVADNAEEILQIKEDLSDLNDRVEALEDGSGGGSASSVAWSDVTGKPSTYTPSAHTHSASDITGLNIGWTSSQIALLETVFNNLAYSSASAGQTAAASLISSLRGGSSGGGSSTSTSVSVSGSTMTISGFTATTVSQSGSTLNIA